MVAEEAALWAAEEAALAAEEAALAAEEAALAAEEAALAAEEQAALAAEKEAAMAAGSAKAARKPFANLNWPMPPVYLIERNYTSHRHMMSECKRCRDRRHPLGTSAPFAELMQA